jgi:hypothetical protein
MEAIKKKRMPIFRKTKLAKKCSHAPVRFAETTLSFLGLQQYIYLVRQSL